jgi:hypothetical protein
MIRIIYGIINFATNTLEKMKMLSLAMLEIGFQALHANYLINYLY